MPWLINDKPFAEMERLLRGYKMTGSRLARAIGRSEQTARERLIRPGALTLSELQMICKNGHIPADEIREAIKF